MIYLKRTFVTLALLMIFQLGIHPQSVSAKESLSASLAQMEGFAEDIAETYGKSDWPAIATKLARLRRLWQVTTPTIGANSQYLSAFDSSLTSLESAVHQRSSWKTAHSANALTLALIGLQQNLVPGKVPESVGRMDYWGREIALRAQVGQWDSALSGVQQLNSLWKSLRADVLPSNSVLVQRVDHSTTELASGVHRHIMPNTLKYSTLVLDQVDDLEDIFNKR